ncbi:MAG: chordopoxvirus fusion protein [Firmicutes bacterium]|nr:chordopoxvirus fusion protein [Bacillota bacterium]
MQPAELKKQITGVFPEPQARVLVELVDLTNRLVTAAEFVELKEIVRELAEAQKRTEQRLDSLTQHMEELAQAQKRTEQRLEELAEAQKRTEQRLDSLAWRVEELAQAQKRTEEALLKLVEEHDKTREQLGGLSITVGYILENEAYKALPELLRRDFGLEVEGRLKRTWVALGDGRYVEVNIIGDGLLADRKVKIVGEAKAQLSKKHVDKFVRTRLNKVKDVFPEVFPVLVTHMISEPDVEEYVRERGIALYYSYDF